MSLFVASGGTFTAGPVTVAGSANNPLSAALDPATDTIHLLYSVGSSPGTVDWVTIDSSNAVGTSGAVSAFTYDSTNAGWSRGSIFMGQPVFGFVPFSGSPANVATVLVGSNLTSPSWTQTNLHGSLSSSWLDICPQITNGGSTLFLQWCVNNYDLDPADIVQIYRASSTDGTTWTAPALYWDVVANPVPGTSPAGNEYDVNAPLAIVVGSTYLMIAYTEIDTSFDEAFVVLGSTVGPAAGLPNKFNLLKTK